MGMGNENGKGKNSNIPHLPIDENLPTKLERSQTIDMEAYLRSKSLYETTNEAQRRQDIINDLTHICREWVKGVRIEEGIKDSECLSEYVRIFTFGSYRLGVHGPGSDVDALCVGPRHVSRS